MTMRFYRFCASAIHEVPYFDGLVVRGGEEVFASWVEDECADPVIVADLPSCQIQVYQKKKRETGRDVQMSVDIDRKGHPTV